MVLAICCVDCVTFNGFQTAELLIADSDGRTAGLPSVLAESSARVVQITKPLKQARTPTNGAIFIVRNMLNNPAQAGRAGEVRLLTDARSRPGLEPDG
jgi:hypothetical protein